MFKIFKLGEVCSIESGSRGKGGASTEGIPSIGGEQISSAGYVLTEKMKYITEEHFKKMVQGVLKPGDTLLVKDGATTGKCAFYRNEYKEAAVNEHVFILRANNLILPRLLYYVITSDKFQSKIKSSIKGIIGGINLSIKNLEIAIPDTIEEQQEIVQILDTMSDIIRLREECISHAQTLIPALFQEMFDNPQTNRKNWQICRMKDIAEIDRQNISPEELKNKRYTYIGLEHIEKETGRILIDPNNQNDVDLKSNKFLFTNRHVLYGKLRPYLNKVALPNFEGVCSTDIFPLLPKDGISNRFFLKTLMSTPYFVNIASSQSSGANLPRIGTAALENIKVFKPDYMLQEQFAQKTIEIESYIKEQDDELKNAEQMFQSLLHHAFTGKLTAKKYGGN